MRPPWLGLAPSRSLLFSRHMRLHNDVIEWASDGYKIMDLQLAYGVA